MRGHQSLPCNDFERSARVQAARAYDAAARAMRGANAVCNFPLEDGEDPPPAPTPTVTRCRAACVIDNCYAARLCVTHHSVCNRPRTVCGSSMACSTIPWDTQYGACKDRGFHVMCMLVHHALGQRPVLFHTRCSSCVLDAAMLQAYLGPARPGTCGQWAARAPRRCCRSGPSLRSASRVRSSARAAPPPPPAATTARPPSSMQPLQPSRWAEIPRPMTSGMHVAV